MLNLRRTLIGMLALALLGLPTAPHSAAAQTGTQTYEVTVTNITNSKQVLSPPLLATHAASVHAWQRGQTASAGVEKVAEEGMSDLLASELKGVATDVVVSHAHLLPGDSITLLITAKQGDVLSTASMLSQTNDGFTGLDSAALVDGSTDTIAYDAGTEDNTELAADVPARRSTARTTAPTPIRTSRSARMAASQAKRMSRPTSTGAVPSPATRSAPFRPPPSRLACRRMM